MNPGHRVVFLWHYLASYISYSSPNIWYNTTYIVKESGDMIVASESLKNSQWKVTV